MKILLPIMIMFLFGCNNIAQVNKDYSGGDRTVTCTLTNFKTLPKTITGQVAFELKSTISIAVFNKDKSERVDMTFPKDKCK